MQLVSRIVSFAMVSLYTLRWCDVLTLMRVPLQAWLPGWLLRNFFLDAISQW